MYAGIKTPLLSSEIFIRKIENNFKEGKFAKRKPSRFWLTDAKTSKVELN
jgi:hypothetical protein